MTLIATDDAPPHDADCPSWDLSDLYADLDDPRIDETLTSATVDADAFSDRYRGQVGTLAKSDTGALAEAIRTYEAIHQALAKPGNFASLRFNAATTPEHGAALQRIRERVTAATVPLLFFEVELTQLGGGRLACLAADPALAPYAHYLNGLRATAPFRLSESEERILEETANTGRRAFVRLFQEITSNLRFRMPGSDQDMTLSQAVALQQSADRSLRRESAVAISAGLEPQLRTAAYLFNTLVQDKATLDRLRGYAYSEEERHIANELAPEIVNTVMAAAEAGFPLVARYYRAKGRLLGIDRMAHYDRYAPIGVEENLHTFAEARDIVLAGFSEFSTEYESAARLFFDCNWIDAAPRPSKRGGAFCSYVTPDLHPYVFMNYLGKMGDVRTLAHELGHAVHSYVARGQSFLNYHGTLPMAEMASTFAEMLVFDDLQRHETDPGRLLMLYGNQIDQAIATLFRQASLYRFERAVHRERRNGELSTARFGELWQENVGAMFGDSLSLEPGHAAWWSYVSHFVATPFYVYAYTFGVMLALALFTRLKSEGREGFAPIYLDLLRSGGSRSPQELVNPLGVDLADPDFWMGAIRAFEILVERFEALSDSAQR